ncbi:MAG: hypothetical protein WDN06_01270 [Asticcacaulis sp.]
MSQPAYPIAKNIQHALSQLKAGAAVRAVRESEAAHLAGGRVAFVSENAGPVYERHEDAMAALGGLTEDSAVRLVARLKEVSRRHAKPLEPVFRDGERWPKAAKPLESVWQLSVSYWKVLDAARKTPAAPMGKPARALRRKGGETLTPEEVLGLVDSPLVAARPQKALDFGLFDFPLPENPEIIIADE